MELADTLFLNEWVEAADPQRRLKFRRDSTGFYEREASDGRRFVHENLLWKIEGGRLHLKFAHARLWTDVGALVRAGSAPAGSRIGQRELVLEADPYMKAIEELPSGQLVFSSDSGAALLG